MAEGNPKSQAHGPQAVVVECPDCRQPGFVEAWPRITSSVDEQPTQLLMDGKLFQYTCPVCGKTVAMTYDCLFHDVEHRMFLLYTTSPKADEEGPVFLENLIRETEREERSRMVNGSAGEDTVSTSDQLLMMQPPYQARLVRTTFELCEKARILAAGYDDRVIELMKVGIKRGMLKEGIIGARDILIYERTMPDGGVSFVITGEIPGDVVGVPGGYDYCKGFLEEAEEDGELEGRYRFDAAWANEFLP